MSLKAKIEAVIYASEEPVTLAQLIGLLGQEGQAELDRLDDAQRNLPLEPEPDDPDALNEEVLAEAPALPAAEPEATPGPTEPSVEPPAEPAPEANLTHVEALHRAALEEAHLLAERRHHAEADDAAMSSAEGSEPEPASEPAVAEPKPHPSVEPAATDVPSDLDTEAEAKRLAREERARAARLRDFFRSLLDELIADYCNNDRGLEVREVAGGFRLATKPEYHDAVRGFVKSLKPPLKLSLQALETLAVIAYKQPITAPEISEIRGVDSGGVLGSLIARKLVSTAGRKQVIGRPILYKTTRDFLLRFGLKDISELPSIEEFEKMAGELADEPVQEEIEMPDQTTPAEDPASGEEPESPIEPQTSQAPQAEEEDPRVTPADEAIVDGRISGLPPDYNADQLPEGGGDSPALDAEIQADAERDARRRSEEG